MQNKILTAPAIFLAIIVSTWSVELLKLTTIPDGLFYDQFTRLQTSAPDSSVILLETDKEPDYEAWSLVINNLLNNGARAIVFVKPVQLNDDLQGRQNIIIPRQLQPDPIQPGKYMTSEKNLSAPGVAHPPQTYGVYREQWSWFDTSNGRILSLESETASRLGLGIPEEPVFQINFRRQVLPKIELERVLNGDLIPELLHDKVVVVSSGQPEPGLFTPFKNKIISSAQYHALAINTLLNSEVVRKATPWMSLLILIVYSGISLFILHYSERRYVSHIILTIVISSFIIAYVLLNFFHFWIPLSASTLAILATLIAVSNYKSKLRNAHLIELTNSSEALARTQQSAESFYSSSQPWSQVATMLSQLLDLNRMMLLEKVTGDHRLKEVQSLNCDFEEISEMRRDYHRKPYADAIEIKGPILLTRAYLKKQDKPEDQFLVPLIFAGEVLGFWAFSTEPLDEEQRQSTLSRAEEFSEQIAELLYHRARWREGRKRNENPWRKLLQLDAEPHADQVLNQSFQVIRRKTRTLEEVLDGLGNGALVYDLFGRIVQSNKRIIDVLEARGLAPFDLTAADLIAKLTDKPLPEVRRLLSDLILEKGIIRLPVSNDNYGQMFMMKLSVLSSQNMPSEGVTQQPFQILGILFELMDVSDVKDMCLIKEQLLHRITELLQENIEKLIACGFTDVQKQNPELENILKSIEKIKETKSKIGHISEDSILPVNVFVVLHSALFEKNAAIAAKQIKLIPSLSSNCRFAFASADQLKGLFNAIMDVLIDDSEVDGEITASITDDLDRDKIICKLSSRGFGLPQERINEYVFGTEQLSSDQFKALRAAASHVQHWSGELIIRSAVSKGLEFELHLRSFL